MKIKQTLLIVTSFLFSVSISVSFALFGPAVETVVAYKCQGNPDDYYQYEKGVMNTLVPLSGGTSGESVKFRWDDSLKSCVVTVQVSEGSYRSQNADGSARACNSKNESLVRMNGAWFCAPYRDFQTNDKPVNDDGSPIDPSQIYCGGGQDNYDEESFSCLESGSCNLTQSCNYNEVGMNPDPTSDCIGNGGIYNKGGNPTCKFSEDSCKKKNLKLNKDKKGCEELNECDKKFGTNSNSPEYKACEEARNNPNKDCDKETDPKIRAACEAGAAAAPESYEGCGEARTVLIKCNEDARGLPVLASILRIAVTVLTVIIGVASVGGIAWAATLYAKAEDNSSNVTEARTIIRNIVIGLLLYGFLIAIVNWLVPGGIIG